MSWSPWYISSVHRTATIAYVTNNYVGFRKVTIEGDWILGQDPKVQVEETNTMSICIYLSSDAFVEWESAVRLLQREVFTLLQLTRSRFGRTDWHKWVAE